MAYESPKILYITNDSELKRFLAGDLVENPRTGVMAHPADYDFVLSGSVYSDENWTLHERTPENVWRPLGLFADRSYAIREISRRWNPWKPDAVTAPARGKWTCVRCGRPSDDIPAGFADDYDHPICDRCTGAYR